MNKSRKKILIVQNMIMPYRIPIYDLLNKDYTLTVAHSFGILTNTNVTFKVVHLPVKKISRFVLHKNSLFEFCQNYDVVIGMSDISWLSLMGLGFKKNRKFKIIYWGIGVRASYDTNYGEVTIWDKVRYFLLRKADALLFYSSFPLNRYIENGIDYKKLFVAHNTVAVKTSLQKLARKEILFIGTLYKQKNIYALLNNYLEAFQMTELVPPLRIIGDGDEYQNILDWINENELTEKIILAGKIFDEELLCEHFSRALACISPGQAGLSVLKCMGYGVPFITQKSAITGGEILNIEDGVSGVLYCNDADLKDIILDITKYKSKYVKMGENAKTHYDKCRKPTDMVRGISDAIEYVISI
ncbi:glycosyltransferase [Arenibacter lacus]|uniref:glycosyltransferase n=1 Tax=Arenibacter lacus TaxID=2608629 RepID=UPI00123CC375|nr:glycosyltransferase [Arenibacter lacus]